MDIQQYATQMRQTATQILDDSGLLTILHRFCIPDLIGSYAFDLMIGPDIDIDVLTNDPKMVSRQTLNALLEQDYFQRYEYGDFVRFPKKNRPRGYILVLGITVAEVYWEIETWFVSERSAEERAIQTLLQERLTPVTRSTILGLKYQRQQAGKSKHAISSVDIYRGVLEHNFTTLAEIESHLAAPRTLLSHTTAPEPEAKANPAKNDAP